MTIKEILKDGSLGQKRALFEFDGKTTDAHILVKFNLWWRYFFPNYSVDKDMAVCDDAWFHERIDRHNIEIYRGTLKEFVNIAFRGAAKTSRTKLFVAFVVCNDRDHFRRYFRVLSEDGENSKQIATDVYNMLVSPMVREMYPSIFAKTDAKREETMESFTTATGIKVFSDTVGTGQRGALQEYARPDFIWFEDFENRKSLRSARVTKSIKDNMDEAFTGLAKGGGCVYTANYISEMGNVHTLVTKPSSNKVVLIVPIRENGKSNWPARFTLEDIANMEKDEEDFEGERLCKPSASKDIMFDRERLDAMPAKEPKRTVAGYKIFKEYDASHRYASGHDVAGGVGLDSSTSITIDFDVIPAVVVATFRSNDIKPDVFGDEIKRENEYFGDCLAAVERNNHGHATIARARQIGVNLFATAPRSDTKQQITTSAKEYGWHTNQLTKPKAIYALVKAVNDGLLDLSDEELITEAKSYTRNDLMDDQKDPRLVNATRHFDLLMAAAIAWQMKDHAEVTKPAKTESSELDEELDMMYPEIGI